MLILGIETTCDETAASVVLDGKEILSNVVASQSALHAQYGGVYPEMAARTHVDLIIPTIEKALVEAHVTPNQIDLIAVARGPGLIGPLLIGLNAAKALSLAWETPYIGVNHVEAHLVAAMMSSDTYSFPALGVVVSGGHTFLTKIHDVGQYTMIGTTVDDAIGEAFDKVAQMLDLPYPGGPHIEELAHSGDPTTYPYKAGKVKGHPYDFSFSGLKTNVLYTVKGQNGSKNSPSQITEQEKAHVAASFQHTALSDIATKARQAFAAQNCEAIYIGGGVSQNRYLRGLLSDLPVHWPTPALCLDNAAMIAGLAYHKKTPSPLTLEPEPRIRNTL